MSRTDDFRSILVICTRQIGDVLLTTPLIRAAKARWPQARIDVLGFAGTLGMLDGNPDIGECIEVQPGSGWWASLGLIRRLWRRYDLALVAQHTDRAHLYGWVAARVRSGQLPAGQRSGWKAAWLHHAVPINAAHSHAVIAKLRLLDPWQPVGEAEVVAPMGKALPEDVSRRLRSPYVVLQVPSLVRYKQWPAAHYTALANALAAEGWQVCLTGGPSPADRTMVAGVAASAASPQVLDTAGRLDFHQMAGLLRGAVLYIGPDTSITHLAAACGIPVIALFGPTDPRFWGPWSGRLPPVVPYERRAALQRCGQVSLLQGPQDCVPCNRAGCDNHNDSVSLCLETMTPERVLSEARRRLTEAGHVAPAQRVSP